MDNNLLKTLREKYPEYIIEDFTNTPIGQMITFGYYVKENYTLSTTIEDLYNEFINKDKDYENTRND